jgi:hypothetical protein
VSLTASLLVALLAASAPPKKRPNMPVGWTWPPSPAMKAAGAECLARLDAASVEYTRGKPLKTHREHGLLGVEAFYGTYPRAETERWLRIADELDLVPTGGSDFHGEMNPAVTQPGILLPQATAERLCAWLGVAA